MSGRQIAVVGDYLGLIAALRARVAELGINYETLDVLAGWTDTYSTKLLAPEPAKHLGPMSFDAILGATGVKLVVIEDEEATKRLQKRRDFSPRRRPVRTPGEHGYVVRRDTREFMRQMSILAVAGRMMKISPNKRKKIARKAAKARWRSP